LVPAKER